MEELLTIESLIALLTLTSLEVVLGIDNIVLLAVMSERLAPGLRKRARRIGLLGAMVMRILLLFSIGWVMQLTTPLFTVFGMEVTGRDLVMIIGGVFLIGKATTEIHAKVEGPETTEERAPAYASFGQIIAYIIAMDLVFSLDSVITAVGMVDHITIMVIAVVVAVGLMMVFAEGVSSFISRHPTLKMLALSFMLLVGFMLVLEGFGKHIERGYIYSAMAFSLAVEVLNIRVRKVSRRKSKVNPFA